MKASTWLALLGLSAGYVDAQSSSKKLLPAIPSGHDLLDLLHLEPQKTHDLHFREWIGHSSLTHAFGNIKATFNYPAVMLDHSAHVSVTCRSTGLEVCFGNLEAQQEAQTKWDVTDSPLILGTHHAGCGSYSDGARSYWKATKMTTDLSDRCSQLTAQEVEPDEAMEEFELEWGSYEDSTDSRAMTRRDSQALIASSEEHDIHDDPSALSEFFGIDWKYDYPMNDTSPMDYNGTVNPMRRRATSTLRRRFEWSDLNPLPGLKKLGQKVVQVCEDVGTAVYETGKKVVETVTSVVTEVGKFIQDPAGYEWTLGTAVSRDYNIGGSSGAVTKQTSTVFGDGSAVEVHSTTTVSMVCENCYAKGNVKIGGEIAFSFRDGLKRGHLAAGAGFDSQLALGLKMERKDKLKQIKRQLFAKNLLNLEIPKMISVGPQISLSASLDLEFEAKAELVVGARFEITQGEARIDLVDSSQSSLTGFEPKFTPIYKFDGAQAKITLDIGFPIGLEFGIDLGNGKWKQTVSLSEVPIFEAVASIPTDVCSGLDITVAIKNELVVSVGQPSVFSETLDSRDIYRKPVLCIGETQASPDAPEPISSPAAKRSVLHPKAVHPSVVHRRTPPSGLDHVRRDYSVDSSSVHTRRAYAPGIHHNVTNPEQAVNSTFGKPAAYDAPTIYPDHANATVTDSVTGFSYQVITDVNHTAIVFAGREDRVYLAPYGDAEASAGAPFAYEASVSSAVVMGDVFGGFLNYNPTEMEKTGVSNLRSSRLTNVPLGARFIALTEIHTNQLSKGKGMFMGIDTRENTLYALATCSVKKMGTRVYVVDVNTDAMKKLNNNELKDSIVGGQVNGCTYVYLTSGQTGLTLGQH